VTADQKIAAKVVGDHIVVTDHRQCKGCDCPALLELTWEEASVLRLLVHRAMRAYGETHPPSWESEDERGAHPRSRGGSR
jgi:hypothetical protein